MKELLATILRETTVRGHPLTGAAANRKRSL
jgi:hypothetical protein